MRINLLGGSNLTRSRIAGAARCINYFPERNHQDSPTPFTYYQRPGLVPQVQGPIGAVRGLYLASNDDQYAVIGLTVYNIPKGTWQLNQIGQLNEARGNPVSFTDNGITIMLVDGSGQGYTIDMASKTFGVYNDPTGNFIGATKVDFLDTFILWNNVGTNIFGSTLSNTTQTDGLYFAAKAGYPDQLQSLIVNRREIILLGKRKSEIWYDAGNPLFPFAELPGTYIEHGCVAPYSVASEDINVYWLGSDLQGQGIVFRQRGYDTRRISDHALEFALRQIVSNGGSIADAQAYTYQQDGHVFYVLTLPSADQTWVYDASLGEDTGTSMWHQRAWTDANGLLHRERANCYAVINGLPTVGDWSNGTIYTLDPTTYTDTLTVGGNPGPIAFIKGFPHIATSRSQMNIEISTDNKLLSHRIFMLDFEAGDAPLDANGNPALIGLAVSRDRGKTYGNPILISAGARGQYDAVPSWSNLGQARDAIFEVRHSINGPAAINGAWLMMDMPGAN